MSNKYIRLFRNPFFSAFVSYVVLALVGIIYPLGWVFLFSILFSYVLSDLILNGFIHGGKGWSKIFDEADFTHKGHAYLVFLVGIVVGTLLSSFIADSIFQYAQTHMIWSYALLLTDFAVVVAVLGDLEWRFYTK
jgi:hypothetical protein